MAREMKDSGIAWIGEIPEEWRVENIGSCLKEIHNLNYDCLEDNALQFKMGNIISKKNGDSKYNPETLEAYNQVEPNDIIINGLNLSFDYISQRIGQVKEKGVITSAYLAIRPLQHLSSNYITYLLKSYDNCKALHGMGKGLRQTLSYKEFRRYLIFHPSLPEQRAIADYLDRKCGEIDELISLQEKMIEELKAYKQSVITEAVTKGLNSDVPMKDSGIKWIGEIPEHWDIMKISQLCSVITDYVASGSFADIKENVKYIDTPDYAMLVRTTDLSNKNQNVKRVYISKASYDFLSNSNLFGGEIVLPNIGASIGDVYKVPNDLYPFMSLAPNSIMLKSRYDNQFLFYYFSSQSGREAITRLGDSTAQGKFNKTDLRALRISVPPLPEQQSIADYLDNKCSEIDSLIALKQKKIEELKEYKKSIIYEYVTGKKEV